jgi:hypothetical protein
MHYRLRDGRIGKAGSEISNSLEVSIEMANVYLFMV